MPLIFVLIVLGSIAVGAAQVWMPFIGPALIVGSVALPMMLAAPYHWLISGIVVSLLGSRLLMLIGAPSLVAYAHFAVFLIVLLKVLLLPSPIQPETRKILGLVSILVLAVVASALVSGWVQLRPILLWLVLAEPFVIYALMRSLHKEGRLFVMWSALLTALAQIPFAWQQFAIHGVGDEIKGTLIQQGAGHHIVGAVCVVASILWLTETTKSRSRGPFLTIGIAGLLMSVGVLSDAKQVFAALAVASVPTILYLTRHKPLIGILVLTLPVALVGIGSSLNSSMASLVSQDVIGDNLSLKFSYVEMANDAMDMEAVAFGLGPGNGASRVALLTIPSYGTVPEALVGDSPAALASALWDADREIHSVNPGSSTNSPFTSVLGIYTDLGIVGSVVYASLGVVVWKSLNRCLPQQQRLGQTLLLLALTLGLIYTWLDEPGFTVFLAVTLASLSTADELYPSPSQAIHRDTVLDRRSILEKTISTSTIR